MNSLTDSLMAECFAGNDTNQVDAAFSIFGLTGWILADKNDDMSSGDQSITFTNLGPTNGGNSGDWGITSILGFSDVLITLKAGNGFGAFKVDTTSGSWTTSKGLSHASIYYRDGVNNPPPVPVPASLPLLAAGLGLTGFLARRRKT